MVEHNHAGKTKPKPKYISGLMLSYLKAHASIINGLHHQHGSLVINMHNCLRRFRKLVMTIKQENIEN